MTNSSLFFLFIHFHRLCIYIFRELDLKAKCILEMEGNKTTLYNTKVCYCLCMIRIYLYSKNWISISKLNSKVFCIELTSCFNRQLFMSTCKYRNFWIGLQYRVDHDIFEFRFRSYTLDPSHTCPSCDFRLE